MVLRSDDPTLWRGHADTEPDAVSDGAADSTPLTQPRPAAGVWQSSASPSIVAAAALAVTLLRWWTSRNRRIFHVTPDEPGQLAIARYLGHGVVRWNMFDHSTWRPGFGALISPITWFTDDPTTGFRFALAVNAVLGGLSFLLLYSLARRLTVLSGRWCVVAALVVSCSPAMLFVTDWVWSESLAQAMFLSFVAAALAFQRRPSWWTAAAMIAAAVGGYTTHSRMLTLVLGVVVLAVWAAAARRWSWPSALGAVVAAVAGTALSEWWFRYLVRHIWENPAKTNSFGGVRDQLKKLPEIAVSVVGQSWYALVTTAGLFGFGLIVLVRRALLHRSVSLSPDPVGGFPETRPRATHSNDGPAPQTLQGGWGGAGMSVGAARTVLVAVLPLMGLSMLFMAGRPRPDQAVYGRYIDVALTPLILVGFGALVTASRRFLLVAGAAILTAIVAASILLDARRGTQLEGGGWVRPMTLGLTAIAGKARGVLVWQIDAVAIAALVVLVVVAVATRSRRPWTGALAVTVVLGVLIVGGYGRTRWVASGALNSWTKASSVQDVVPSILPEGTPVRYHFVSNSKNPAANISTQRQRRQIYQFYLPHNPFYLDKPDSPGADSPFVFAPQHTAELEDAGYEVVWRDPGARMALWKAPESAD